MLRVERRIEKLQRAFGISDRAAPFEEHRIVFIDSDGQESPETLLISEGRMEWIKGDGSE